MPVRRFASLIAALVVGTVAVGCGDSGSSRNPAAPDRMTGAAAGPGSAAGPGIPGIPGSPGMNGPAIGGGVSMAVSSEFDYLAGMIPHHEEAIETAAILHAGTNRQQMRDFASAIISTQRAEVNQMRGWLAAWYPGRPTTVDYRPMMRDLGGLTGDALDRAFLEDMIPHHAMAVMMSQQLLMRRIAVHQELVPFATTISDTQRAEIVTMRTWLAEWFGAWPR